MSYAPPNMTKTSEFPIEPEVRIRDGRVIRSFADAIVLLREHESRPGIDNRDEVLHGLERAQNGDERRAAAEAFQDWVSELDLALSLPGAKGRQGPSAAGRGVD
jgi:hypothetical protein